MKVDINGQGQILFDEFCNWSAKKNLDLDTDDDDNAHENIKNTQNNLTKLKNKQLEVAVKRLQVAEEDQAKRDKEMIAYQEVGKRKDAKRQLEIKRMEEDLKNARP